MVNWKNMKNRFLLLLQILFSFSAGLFARNDERALLFDSLANITIEQLSRVELIAAAQQVVQVDTAADPFLAEVQDVLGAREMMRAILPVVFGDCTPEQLRELMRFMCSEANQRITSEQVTATVGARLLADMLTLLESQTVNNHIIDKLPIINDKEYEDLVDEYLNLASILPGMEEISKFSQKALDAAPDNTTAKFIQDVMDIVRERCAAYFKDALVDYVTKEHLREAIAFYSQPYLRQMMQGVNTLPTALLNGEDNPNTQFAIEYMQTKLRAIQYIDTAVLFTDTMAAINNHIAFISSKLLVKDIEPIYPIMTLTLKKKQTYLGQTRDGIPHGKGELTDKKGNRYSGDFRNGMRHGLITQHSPNGDSITQLWVGGVLQKNPNISLERPVAYHDGKPIGYGYRGSRMDKSFERGFFIDGELEGTGERIDYSKNIIEKGKFSNGQLVKGYITRHSKNTKNQAECELKGEFFYSSLGLITKGTATLETVENGEKVRAIMKGVIIDGLLYGNGTTIASNVRNTIVSEGYFAYGKLYGEGHQTIKRNLGLEIESYDGDFFAGKYHGHGVLNSLTMDVDSAMINSVQINGNYQCGEVQGAFVCDECINVNKLSSYERILSRFGFRFLGNQFVQLNSDTLKIHIEGNMNYGELDGEAEIVLSNGNYCKGIFNNGNFVRGTARITYSDGSIYEGGLVGNQFDGKGKFVNAKGMIYEGIFKKGVCVKGVYKNKRGVVMGKVVGLN